MTREDFSRKAKDAADKEMAKVIPQIRERCRREMDAGGEKALFDEWLANRS